MKFRADITKLYWGNPGFPVFDETGTEVARSYLHAYATCPDFDGDGVDERPVLVPGTDSTWTTAEELQRAQELAVLIAAGLNITAAHLEPLPDREETT
jgi:hypothetical protein